MKAMTAIGVGFWVFERRIFCELIYITTILNCKLNFLVTKSEQTVSVAFRTVCPKWLKNKCFFFQVLSKLQANIDDLRSSKVFSDYSGCVALGFNEIKNPGPTLNRTTNLVLEDSSPIARTRR